MGRFRTWFDRTGRSARRRRATISSTWRRRSLAFEQCEPRLALSAATDAAWVLDSNLPIEWSLRPDLEIRPAFVVYSGSLRVTLEDNSSLAEGGAILFLNAASLRSKWVLQNAFDADGVTWRLGGSPELDGALDFGGASFDLAEPGHQTLGESSIMPIPPPAQESDSDGGAIDLTAILAPTSSWNSSSPWSLASAGRSVEAPPSPATQALPAPRPVSPLEGLRGRAIVYEVALIEEAPRLLAERNVDDWAHASADLPQLSPWGAAFDSHAPPWRTASARDAAVVDESLAADAAAPGSVKTSEAIDAAASHRPASESVSDGSAKAPRPSAHQEAASDSSSTKRDAVLTEWTDDAEAPTSEPAAPNVLAASRHRWAAGLVAALVMGARPLSRFMRRTAGNFMELRPPRPRSIFGKLGGGRG
jgi:hypothetical protein